MKTLYRVCVLLLVFFGPQFAVCEDTPASTEDIAQLIGMSLEELEAPMSNEDMQNCRKHMNNGFFQELDDAEMVRCAHHLYEDASERKALAATVKSNEVDEQKELALQAEVQTLYDNLKECQQDQEKFKDIDARMLPLFQSARVETFVLALLLLGGILYLFGSLAGSAARTPMKNASLEVHGLKLSDAAIRPGSEVWTIWNRSRYDVDMTGCCLRVGDHIFHFDDGYNLARGTNIEIHAGPDAREIKSLPIADHDKFDSRRCAQLYWTSASVYPESGDGRASLIDASDHLIVMSRN